MTYSQRLAIVKNNNKLIVLVDKETIIKAKAQSTPIVMISALGPLTSTTPITTPQPTLSSSKQKAKDISLVATIKKVIYQVIYTSTLLTKYFSKKTEDLIVQKLLDNLTLTIKNKKIVNIPDFTISTFRQ